MQPQTSPSGSSKNNKVIVIIIAVLLALGLFGSLGMYMFGKLLGFGIQKTIEVGSGIKVDYNNGGGIGGILPGTNGTPTVKMGDGKNGELEIGDAVKLPKNFPKNFPLMSGLTYTTAYSNSDESGDTFYVGFSSKSSIDDIQNYYEAELKKLGYQSDNVSTTANYYLESFTDNVAEDKSNNVVLNVTSQDGTAFGSLTLTIAK